MKATKAILGDYIGILRFRVDVGIKERNMKTL